MFFVSLERLRKIHCYVGGGLELSVMRSLSGLCYIVH